MKKIVIAFEILIVFLFMAKFIAIGEIVKRTEISGYLSWSADHALADSFSRTSGSSSVRDVFEDTLTNERNLMVSLEDRRKQLENREKFIRFEEKRINTVKKEIVAKMEMLQGREGEKPLPQESDKDDKKRFKELAKVYEATPPDKVSALFTKMDNKTAAEIILQMNNKKAGAVWANLDPGKAVEIAKTMSGM